MNNKPKIVLAVTGASGSVYAKKLIEILHTFHKEKKIDDASIVFTDNAFTVWKQEIGSAPDIPFRMYDNKDFSAPFASGSSDFSVMIICPCSTGMLGRIATGTSNDLVSRSADVMLKERRKLILVIRETPLNLMHIRNMEAVTLAGGIILPACPSFYSRPATPDDIVMTVINRILSLAGIPNPGAYSWGKDS